MCIRDRTDTAYPGEIVILPSDSVRLNDVLGDPTRLPRKRWREDPLPMLRTSIAPKTAAQRERLLDALTQLADTDPLLRCEVDSITHEIILSFLGRVQLEVVSALLSEKYKLETVVKEPTVIYMERPLKAEMCIRDSLACMIKEKKYGRHQYLNSKSQFR